MTEEISAEVKRIIDDTVHYKAGVRIMGAVIAHITSVCDRKITGEEIGCAIKNIDTYIDCCFISGICADDGLVKAYNEDPFKFLDNVQMTKKIFNLYKTVQAKFYRDNFTKIHSKHQIESVLESVFVQEDEEE